MILSERLNNLLDYLGIKDTFIATQMPGDLTEFCTTKIDRIAGLALVIPSRINPEALKALEEKVIILNGESGIPADTAQKAMFELPQARQVCLQNYHTTAWSDIGVERPEELCQHLISFFSSLPTRSKGVVKRTKSGSVGGISFEIMGSGPPLLLPPFFLAESQWDPVLENLSKHFTLIVLGGAYIGGVAMLEDRAKLNSYKDMFSILTSRMQISINANLLEIGCGSGALCRHILKSRSDLIVTGIDNNNYLLREGVKLAKSDGVRLRDRSRQASPEEIGTLCLMKGNATSLPFDDNSFDAIFSITVLEECNAEKALREMARTVRKGSPVGVVVRAIDMPQWWNINLPLSIATKVNRQPQSISANAVADRSIYSKMINAGFKGVQGYPFLVTFDKPSNPIWNYRVSHAISLLDKNEKAVWDQAIGDAKTDGLLFQANPVHCAIGWKKD